MIRTDVPARGFDEATEEDKVQVLQSPILYSILSLRFEEADSLLRISAESGLQNPAWFYLKNYLDFLDAVISGDRSSYESYLENSGRWIDSIQKLFGDDPGARIHMSSIHLQSSFLSAYYGENFNAAKHFYNAHRLLRQSLAAGSTEAGDGGNGGLILRNRGLIALGIGSVPEEYRWLLKIFGMKGEIAEGLGYLEDYLSSATGPERIEACIIFQFVSHSVNAGLSEDDVLVEGCGDSLTLSRYSMALVDLASGRSKKVVKNLEHYQQSDEERALPYLDLLLGEAMLNGLAPGANKPLERFLGEHSGENYRHYAYHKLSWHYLLSGEWEQYQLTRQKVIDSGEAYLDADRQALSEARDTLVVNSELLQARLLFDGGYYREALSQLKDDPAIVLRNRKDSIEYKYRLARVYDRIDDKNTAIRYYQEVLASGSGEKWYFVPNSALQLGIIHEAEGEKEQALGYYRECLKINRSAYEKSIDYKARQGIRRLED